MGRSRTADVEDPGTKSTLVQIPSFAKEMSHSPAWETLHSGIFRAWRLIGNREAGDFLESVNTDRISLPTPRGGQYPDSLRFLARRFKEQMLGLLGWMVSMYFS